MLARYRNARPAQAALINAAIDARRLGMGIALPRDFLEAAAPGYLSDTDWDALSEDWLEQALAYTATPCKGTRGPLARIRPRDAPAHGSVYRLADYLEQHGRRARRQHIPPASFWQAAARFASPSDLPALASAAEGRGLLRDAARLRKQATGLGNIFQAAALIWLCYSLQLSSPDPGPVQWAVARVSFDDSFGAALLLDTMLEVGAEEHVAGLLARDLTAHIPLDDLHGVARLLDALQRAGAVDQTAALARRAATHAPLNDPAAVARLLDTPQESGADGQAALLARDPAAHVSLDNPGGLARLLDTLRRAGAADQAAALACRAASHAPFDNPGDLARLLDTLQSIGAAEQAAALLARDPAVRISLNDPGGVARLLDALLLGALGKMGAAEQAAILACRAAANAPLVNPGGLALLLGALRRTGAAEQAAILADRAAAGASLDNPNGVTSLLEALREAGAAEHARVLIDRLPAEGCFDLFLVQPGHQLPYQFGRERNGSPAPSWSWDDLD